MVFSIRGDTSKTYNTRNKKKTVYNFLWNYRKICVNVITTMIPYPWGH